MATAVLERSLSGPKIVPVLKSTKRILVIEHDAALRKVLHHLFSSEAIRSSSCQMRFLTWTCFIK